MKQPPDKEFMSPERSMKRPAVHVSPEGYEYAKSPIVHVSPERYAKSDTFLPGIMMVHHYIISRILRRT